MVFLKRNGAMNPYKVIPDWAIAMKRDHEGYQSISKIFNTVLDFYQVGRRSVLELDNRPEMSKARNVTAYLCQRLEGHASASIGRHLKRNHSTVRHGVIRINKQMKEDPYIQNDVRRICYRLGVSPSRANPVELTSTFDPWKYRRDRGYPS